jgi:hypothetical protein
MRIVNLCSSGSHYRSLGLWIKPLLEEREHTFATIDPYRVQPEGTAFDILLTTAPWWNREIPWILHAGRVGVPWLYHPEGWDNVHPVPHRDHVGNSKNYKWMEHPDTLLSYGEPMTAAAIRFQSMNTNSIVATGSPRFDLYHNFSGVSKVYDRVPPGNKRVLVCTATQWDHSFIIEQVDRMKGVSVVVRQHQGDPLHKYGKYGNLLVHPEGCDMSVEHSDHGYNPSVEDMMEYAAQLNGADVVISFAGTSALEAMLLERPVVTVGCLPEEATDKERGHLWIHYGNPRSHYIDVDAPHSTYHVHPDPYTVAEKVRQAIEEGPKHTSLEKAESILGPRDGRAAERVVGTIESNA